MPYPYYNDPYTEMRTDEVYYNIFCCFKKISRLPGESLLLVFCQHFPTVLQIDFYSAQCSGSVTAATGWVALYQKHSNAIIRMPGNGLSLTFFKAYVCNFYSLFFQQFVLSRRRTDFRLPNPHRSLRLSLQHCLALPRWYT